MFGITKKIIKTIKRNSAEKKYGNLKFEKIQFGTYPQSDAKTAEPIEWLVLKKENGKALLLSDKVLHSMRFDADSSDFARSEVCNWLNGHFYKNAFSETEKLRIETLSGANVKVSLLSYEEATEALPAESLRRRPVTNVVKRMKLAGYNKKTGMGNWMLRTPSNKYKPTAAIQIVGVKGEIDLLPVNVPGYGVVPAIIIKM